MPQAPCPTIFLGLNVQHIRHSFSCFFDATPITKAPFLENASSCGGEINTTGKR
jgi:hypothetical protein